MSETGEGIETRTGLEFQNYSEKERTQIRYLGESKAAIRHLDLEDNRDMGRLLATTRNPRVKRWIDGVEGMDVSDVRWWADRYKEHGGTANQGDWEVLFGISGSSGNKDIKLSQVGEYQGFVNCYSDREMRQMVRKNSQLLASRITRETDIVELSVAKWPPAPSGQVDSALRQSCLEINKLKGKMSRKEAGKYSKPGKPDMVIVAFIEPENNPSQKVFEKAGFIRRGLVEYGEADQEMTGENKVFMYELDWEKLNQMMHEESDKEFLSRLGRDNS